MEQYDYIITGAGASGLMLAYRMAQDTFFDDKSILILDKEKNITNNRTWCFWEDGTGEWDHLLHKIWPKIYFGSDDYSQVIDADPYHYKMIRSAKFYQALWKIIDKKEHIKFLKASVNSIVEHDNQAEVITDKGTFTGAKILNSIVLNRDYLNQKKYPILQQHFIGWFIKTDSEAFDDDIATFMDFEIPQNGNTAFMYVLPTSKTEALFEYTLFSEKLLTNDAYENAIIDYLNKKGIKNYTIEESERGAIPMTSYKFHKQNTRHVLNIGTSGGWTKASTGYTFMNTTKKTKQLTEFLKSENDLRKFTKLTKFWFYDLLLLDVLAKYNEDGPKLFSSLFRKTKIQTIFKFLDEESTFAEDLRIVTAVPPIRFVKALLKRMIYGV
ncbi:lycopene cyclase family protein [Paucihalobacter sp.]|uniref:lycopene cyclase family protein n=1 Tax=Paucihalobacter sp. TaxID=2850405 RepID=UPI002FE300B7